MVEQVSDKAQAHGEAAVKKKAQALERLKVEYVAIDSIKPNSYNPNRQSDNDFELLVRSMTEDGFTQPIVCQKDTHEIVDGEHRWRAARHLQMPTVPVVFVEMTAEQMRIATLRHNRARGSEDVDLGIQLLRDLRELGALDWARDSLMLDDKALERMLSDVPVAEQLAGEEYGGAWAPTRTGISDRTDDSGQSSLTDAAKAQADDFNARLAAAGSDQERIVIERDYRTNQVRVQAFFSDEQAQLVRSVLEPKPATKLLELCMIKQAREKAAATDDFDATE